MPYENIGDLPESVRIIYQNMHKKYLKRHSTMHGMNIKNLKIVKVMPHVKKHLSKLHGQLLNKLIIKTNLERGRKMDDY